MTSKKKSNTENNAWPWIICIVVILIVGWLFFYFQQEIGWENVTDAAILKEHIISYGVWGPVLYIALLIVAVIVSQIPNIPLAISAGMIFGPLWGGIYSLIGGVIGASIDFWIGRLLGRNAIKKITGKTIHFYDHGTDRFVGKIVFITRLLPIFSFDIISYGAGLTNLSFKFFVLATLLGMTPMTFVLTYLGEAIQINVIVTTLLTLLVVVGFVLLPFLIQRYNIWGLKDKIRFE